MTASPRRMRRRRMASSLSVAAALCFITCLPNAASAAIVEADQRSAPQRRTQVDFGDDFGQTETLPPNNGGGSDEFNYRSCGSGIKQAGFATLQFLYDVETNVSMTASTFLTSRQQQQQQDQLEFLESTVFPQTLSTALLERLQERVCGYTFYQPVLEVISISSGKADEVWETCNLTQVESRSCTRYLGSILIGVNNTAILGSVSLKVAKHVMPIMAADMFEGWYAQWMTDKLASTPLDINGDPDYVGAVQVTKVGYVGVPIFAQASAAKVDSSGGLTTFGYVLLFLGLWLLLSICCWGYYVYSNMIEEEDEDSVTDQKLKTATDGGYNNNNNNNNNKTFTIEEEEEELARKNLQLPSAQKARVPSSSFARMGIFPVEIDTQSKQPVTPLQTPQAIRSPVAHRRVQSAGNDFYQFHPTTPGGRQASGDPRFVSVTPQDPRSSRTRTYETPTSPPQLSYRDYQPTDPYQMGANSITESHQPYNNYSLDQTYLLTHRLPSSYNQELLNNSLPEWATASPYHDEDYSKRQQPGTTNTVVDSRGRVRKEIAL